MYVNDDDDDDLDSDCDDSGFGMTSVLIGTDDESVTDPALSSLSLSFSSFSSPSVFFDLGAISNDFFPIADAIPIIVIVVLVLLMMYIDY